VTKGARNRNKFLGRGGTRRGAARSEPEQIAMFEIPDDEDEIPVAELGELARDVNRMRLETSSNLYAQRRAYW
jgi:hypothetical protein